MLKPAQCWLCIHSKPCIVGCIYIVHSEPSFKDKYQEQISESKSAQSIKQDSSNINRFMENALEHRSIQISLKKITQFTFCIYEHAIKRLLVDHMKSNYKHTTWVGVKNFGFTEEQKNIEQGSIKLKELHVCIMCVQKKMAAWRSKCRKMPESDICVCRKAKVVELHIVCMLKQS